MKKFGLKLAVFSTIVSLLSFFTPLPVQATTSWQMVGGYGLGNPDNITIATMEVWQNALYAGVGREATSARIYRSANGTTWDLVEDNFGSDDLNVILDFAAFGDYLYASIGSETDPLIPVAGEIWRTNDGTNWAQTGAAGLGDADNYEFYDFEEFDGQLYVGSRNATGAQLFRTVDGVTWDDVTDDGFGVVANTIIWGLKSFGGYIWAGTANAAGAQIWRSTTGDDGSWTDKYWDYATLDPPEPQFNIVNNFFEFDGYLFWTACSAAGAQILKRVTDGNVTDSALGLGDIKNIWFSLDSAEVGGQMYLGTRNETTGGELWALTDGLTGSQVNTDGFGNVDNFALYAITFNKYLYVGLSTVNGLKGLEIWRRLSTSNFGFKNDELPDGTQNQAYTASLETVLAKGAVTYSVTDGNLPPGLSLDSATGAITGTPTEVGDFEFTIKVVDEKDHGDNKNLSIKIVAGAAVTVLPQTGADL